MQFLDTLNARAPHPAVAGGAASFPRIPIEPDPAHALQSGAATAPKLFRIPFPDILEVFGGGLLIAVYSPAARPCSCHDVGLGSVQPKSIGRHSRFAVDMPLLWAR